MIVSPASFHPSPNSPRSRHTAFLHFSKAPLFSAWSLCTCFPSSRKHSYSSSGQILFILLVRVQRLHPLRCFSDLEFSVHSAWSFPLKCSLLFTNNIFVCWLVCLKFVTFPCYGKLIGWMFCLLLTLPGTHQLLHKDFLNKQINEKANILDILE